MVKIKVASKEFYIPKEIMFYPDQILDERTNMWRISFNSVTEPSLTQTLATFAASVNYQVSHIFIHTPSVTVKYYNVNIRVTRDSVLFVDFETEAKPSNVVVSFKSKQQHVGVM
jgi:hypothetical protein